MHPLATGLKAWNQHHVRAMKENVEGVVRSALAEKHKTRFQGQKDRSWKQPIARLTTLILDVWRLPQAFVFRLTAMESTYAFIAAIVYSSVPIQS